MDLHLLIKIIHMISVSVAILVFLARAFTLFTGLQNDQPNPKGRVAYVAVQHLSYTLIVLTGMILLFMNNFQVQPWFYAKIVLFLVLISSLIKTWRKDNTILLAQRRAGLFVSAVALIAIISLVIIKPVFN